MVIVNLGLVNAECKPIVCSPYPACAEQQGFHVQAFLCNGRACSKVHWSQPTSRAWDHTRLGTQVRLLHADSLTLKECYENMHQIYTRVARCVTSMQARVRFSIARVLPEEEACRWHELILGALHSAWLCHAVLWLRATRRATGRAVPRVPVNRKGAHAGACLCLQRRHLHPGALASQC